jgi:hypothetical protein
VTAISSTEQQVVANRVTLVDGPLQLPHPDLVIMQADFLQFGALEVPGNIRGRCWHYLIDRFQRENRPLRNPLMYDKYLGLEAEPSGITFTIYPEETEHHWQYSEVNGLVVSSLSKFLERVNTTLEKQTTNKDRLRVLQQKLGRGVSVAMLGHLDGAADFFMNQAFRRAS